MKSSIQTLYTQYVDVFPQEASWLEALRKQLESRGENDITNRRNFDTGHVTAGSIVVSLPSKKVLLIDHAVLRKQIQPGGHIDPEDDTILSAVYRECQEEAGIPADALRYIPLSEQNPELPFGITVQDIPPNSAKDEPRHHHYDFWYLFTVPDGTKAPNTADIGVSNPQWTSFTSFAENTDFSRQAEKINKLLATS
jgi:8-oxo-dGTP pyrophosphatase MutT (NUDIX family)